MKVIRISDGIHNLIASEAKQQGRTIQKVAERALEVGLLSGNTPLPNKTNLSKLTTVGGRDYVEGAAHLIDTEKDAYPLPQIKKSDGATPGSVSELLHQDMVEGEQRLNAMQDARNKTGIPVIDDAKPGEVIPFTGSPDNPDFEKPCCKNETRPCQHWVWDTDGGEGYVNSLSGRKMEVE